MSRAGAGPLESDDDDEDLDESRPGHLDDDDEYNLAVEDIDPDTGEDGGVRSSASSPPLASYDNRAQASGLMAAEASSSERRINAVISRMQAEEGSGSSSNEQNDAGDDDISSENAVPGQQITRSRGPL